MYKNWIEVSGQIESLSNAHGEVMVLEAYIAHLDHMVQEALMFEPGVKARLQNLITNLSVSIEDLNEK